jgi:5-methylcytosine-specific restriction endonuclease McrA
MLQIKGGDTALLKKVKDWKQRKVWKLTNQWFYCGPCMTLYYFRVFKCRFDWTIPLHCKCGEKMKRAPAVLCKEAKLIRPHFKTTRRVPGQVANWYQDVYLKSDLWKAIRRRVLERDGKRCCRCKRPASVVHHQSYDKDVLAGTADYMLTSLCFDCHAFIEFDGDRKTSLDEANERLQQPVSL